ncbi:hypothetical protein K1W69_01085 [Hoeflea sp. WL0058]|uniref:Alpha/beta hydrolase family protein n=1 Tax=Flavimaribacter sediminis TaxID=2865987 RepID=A0AAE2ZFU1_9HYPH|nr:hypothetical protein [Flavimaribacter sediminis]MBW8635764.1 hypothetical protein [Flavimaribacter sediminis]
MRAPVRYFRLLVPAVVLAMTTTGAFAAFESEFPRADGKMVPVKIYQGSSDPCPPLLVISHSFGGSKNASSNIAEAADEAGFRVIVMEHTESGREAFREIVEGANSRQDFRDAIGSQERHQARFLDLDAIWDKVTRICIPPFSVLAGQSMGAQTTMMEAGAVATIGRFGADRFDAYVALSPQGVGTQFEEDAWRNVKKPVLMITGTRDNGEDGAYENRLTAFEGLPPGFKRIVVIDNATNRDISGHGANSVRDLIPQVVIEFLDNVRNNKMGQPKLHNGVTVSDK